MSTLQGSSRITPFLWFDSNAEEAVNFYLSVFKNSRRLGEFRSPDDQAAPKGTVLTVSFELDGQEFTALNGGPMFKFTQAVSFVVHCEDQAEVDYYWSKLTDGGSKSECGWLKDKYGLSWQIWPAQVMDLVKNSQGVAGNAGHEEAGRRRTRTGRAVVSECSRQFTRQGIEKLCFAGVPHASSRKCSR